MLPSVPDLHREKKKKAWKEVARHPPLSAGPAGPAGAVQEEHLLLLLRNATAAGLLLEHMYVLVCICLFSTPFAADFGPGLERASEGRTAGRVLRFLRLSPPTLGLARMGRWGGRAAGRGVCFSTLLAANFGPAWMGRWKGALPWRGV